ncbi:MAG: cyclic nucleotide-binding domain-containing protein, partial [Spirochaetales bacterium]|nr:cyclic nucleotide-binding domain-containing protein [Spirochaetales bacterium]
LSVLLFTTMGMTASEGAVAGLLGAVILLLVSGIAGATIGMISAPNGPVTILLSGLIVKLSPSYSPGEIFVIISAVLLFTGVFEIIFGLLKGGELVKLLPYPVVASMISAIGILMIKSQVIQLFPGTVTSGWPSYIPLIVALFTLGSIFLYKKLVSRFPSVLLGLLTGIILYQLLTLGSGNVNSHWVIGTLPKVELLKIFYRFSGIKFLNLPWNLIITSSLALTVLVMIDCLLTALVADTQTTMRHNARKELVAQGIGQMLIGLVGGVGGGGTKGSTLANTMAGGRRWSPVFAGLIILVMTLFGRGLGSFLPLSALSGVIMYIGIKMINLNIIYWFKSRRTRIDGINAIIVIIATIFLDVTKAVGIGMIFAVVTFLRREVSRSLIRRQTTIIDYPSPRKRSIKHRDILKEHRDKGLLVELQGDLFFATTDQLYRRIVKRLKGRLVIIIHFRRVLSLDMSGLVLLMQLVHLAEQRGTEIVFCHMHKHLGFGRKLKKAFSMVESNKKINVKIFHSTARALEYAEDEILRNVYKDKDYRITSPVSFEENDLCKGMETKGIDLLKTIAVKKEYKDKESVVILGEESSSLYVVTSGFVEQRIYYGKVSYKILAKYSPGTYFGKLTFFNPGPISATFTVLGNTTVYKIRRADIEKLSNEELKQFLPDFLYSIGRKLSKESVQLISEIERLEAL